MPEANDSPLRALLVYAALATPLAAIVFLLASSFFVAWDGRAVSVRPPGGADEGEPRTYNVLIVNEDGSSGEHTWPAEVVSGLGLPLEPLAIPPDEIDPARPGTRKRRFSMYFVVTRDDGTVEVAPTTSPRSLGLAALLWLVGLGLHNMYRSGSPFDPVRRVASTIPEAQAPAGSPASPRGGAPPKKGPPPTSRHARRGRR